MMAESMRKEEIFPPTVYFKLSANTTLNNNNAPVPASFGLTFSVYPGYSLPPGNYTTHIVLTATFQ